MDFNFPEKIVLRIERTKKFNGVLWLKEHFLKKNRRRSWMKFEIPDEAIQFFSENKKVEIDQVSLITRYQWINETLINILF